MKYSRLGKTGLEVSAVGLGGWVLGGGYDWGPIEFVDAQNSVCAALEAGVNLIDTAPVYGDSEAVLGRALQGRRRQVVLTTKCGLVKNGSWTDHDLRPATIVSQLESSLKNLQTDFIDVYLIHYLDPRVPWQEVLQTLYTLQKQGKIRHIGVCNVPPKILEQMAQTGLISCVQEQLSLLHYQTALKILSICQTYDLGFMAYGPLRGGILSGKYKREPNLRRADARNYFYKCYRGEEFVQAQQTVERVEKLAAQKNVLPTQIALAWVLQQSGVSCALTGARNKEQIIQNARATEVVLTAEELCSLQA